MSRAGAASIAVSLLLSMMLAACSSPPAAPAAVPASTQASVQVSPDGIGEPTTANVPASMPVPANDTANAGASPVNADALPEDVRDYIIKQRLCRHLRNRAASGEGDLESAKLICASGGDAAAWKALIRKYADDDLIGSVLVAEKPLDAETP